MIAVPPLGGDAAKDRYDAHASPLPPLDLGAHVRVEDSFIKRWNKVGVVIGVGRSRDYLVRTPSGE